MARGWKSKAVEAQIETAELGTEAGGDDQPSPEQVELQRKREGLLLSRSRVQRDLESAHNPRYRQILSKALAHLERELAELE